MSHQVVEIARSPDSIAMDSAPNGLMPCEGTRLRLRNERCVVVRAARPADAETIQEFVRCLSVASRRLRFFSPIRELTPAMLARLTESAERGQVVIAESHDEEMACMVAMAQYAPGDDDGTCELACVVADAFQGLGLGRALMAMLIQLARDARYVRAVGDVLCYNEAMLALGRAYDFAVVRSPYDATMLRLERDLKDVLLTETALIPPGVAPQARPTEPSIEVDRHVRLRANRNTDRAPYDASLREESVCGNRGIRANRWLRRPIGSVAKVASSVAALWGGSRFRTKEDEMIGVFVTFHYRDNFDERAVRKIAETARAKLEGMPGLRSKAFTLNSGKREAANFYVWDSEEAAKAFFTDELLDRVAGLYGVRPSVEFVQIATLVENIRP